MEMKFLLIDRSMCGSQRFSTSWCQEEFIVNPLNFVVSGLDQIAGENAISEVFFLVCVNYLFYCSIIIYHYAFAYRGCHHQYVL